MRRSEAKRSEAKRSEAILATEECEATNPLLLSCFAENAPRFARGASRFVRSPISYAATGREKEQKMLDGKKNPFGTVCLKAWDFYFRLHRGFVGRQHLEAIVRLIGEDVLNTILDNCKKHVSERFKEVSERSERALMKDENTRDESKPAKWLQTLYWLNPLLT